MCKRKCYLLVICALLVTTPLMASTQLDEANANFAYEGKPIHPFLVQEFSSWLSDKRPPVITTVDVTASFDTNKYKQSDIQKREKWIFAERKETDGDFESYESFDYRWLGRMANNVHALEVGASGGGSIDKDVELKYPA